jgi:hypothetical protein
MQSTENFQRSTLLEQWLADFKAVIRRFWCALAVACLAACTPPKATPAPAPACAPTPYDTRCVCNTADAAQKTQDAGDAQ